MIGIVIVSHSSKVAEGIKDIADQMNDGSVTLIAAGGADNGRIGTNTLKILEALEQLKDSKSILVFVDLGSASMSSQMAIDMLDEEIKNKIMIVDAPLIEGVIAATIQATTTDDIESVISTAIESKDLRKSLV